MTRLQRIINAFNNYDNFVKKLLKDEPSDTDQMTLTEIRNEVSLLIGELKRYGCQKQKKENIERCK